LEAIFVGRGHPFFLSHSGRDPERARQPKLNLLSRFHLGLVWNAVRRGFSRLLRGDVLDKERYAAFISYRHVEPDRTWAIWESFVIPSGLRNPPDYKRIGRVFRDEEELAASPHLSEDIRDALRRSDWLIVVCSPRSKASEWVDADRSPLPRSSTEIL
jgi:hypothetical protein